MNALVSQTQALDEDAIIRLSRLHRKHAKDLGLRGYAINTIWASIVHSHQSGDSCHSECNPSSDCTEADHLDEGATDGEALEKSCAQYRERDEGDKVRGDARDKASDRDAPIHDECEEWWDPTQDEATEARQR